MRKQTILRTLTVSVLAGLAGCAVPDRAAEEDDWDRREQGVIAATPAELRANPGAFSGKTVRVSGKLSQCFGWECSICPETMTTETADPDRCLGIGFRPLMRGTGFGSDAKEEVFRFASVDLVGEFDPSCWQGGCLDRQVVLRDADVVAVKVRRRSSQGLWLGSLTPLHDAPVAAHASLVDAARKAGFPEDVPTKAFAAQGEPDLAVVCWGYAGGGEPTAWPTSVEGAVYAKTINDHYRCSMARRQAGEWIMQVEV